MSESRLRLVTDNLKTVRPIALGIAVARHLPRQVDTDDLIQEGTLGLIDAAGRFDPKRGVAFPQYSKSRVKGAILDFLRSVDYLSREARRAARAIERVRFELLQRLEREPDDSEICHALGWPLDKLRAFERTSTKQPIALLRNPEKYQAPNSEGTPLSIKDIPDSRAIPADDLACRAQVVTELSRAIEQLPVRWRRLLGLYYGAGLTMKEVGGRLNVNESRVSQIHAEALSRLRGIFEDRGIQWRDAA